MSNTIGFHSDSDPAQPSSEFGSYSYDALASSPMPVEVPPMPELQNASSERSPNWIPSMFGMRSDSGVEVNHYRALGHPPILQGVKILAGAFAQMDVKLMRRVHVPSGRNRVEEVRNHHGGIVARNRSRERVMSSGATMNICTYRSTTMNHAIMAGDGIGAIQRDNGGRPIQTTLLPPYPNTKVVFDEEGKLKIETRIQIGPNGMHTETFKLDPIDCFQIMNLSHDGLSGYPLTEIARHAIGFGLGTHKYGGKTFANGATPKGVLSDPGRPTDDQIKDNMAKWYLAHRGLDNAAKIAYLTGGATFTPMSMSNIDSQLVQIMEEDVLIQSRLLNIPPFLLGMTKSSGLKMQELIQFFVRFTLGDWIANWAQEMRTKLLTEEEWRAGDLFFKFDVSQWLKANFKEHVDALVAATGGAILLRDESREMIDLNPAGDDDRFLNRSTGATDSGDPPAPAPSSERLAEVENRLQRVLINATQSACKTESEKVRAAVGRDGFEDWVKEFYNGEWKSRLSDLVSDEAAETYCNTRRDELISMLEKSGRGAIESNNTNGNFRARGLSLVEMELQSDGHKITKAKEE